MKVKDLVPWRWTRDEDVYKPEYDSPFYALHRDVNRLFDDLSHSVFDMMPYRWGSAFNGPLMPRVDVTETDTEVKVTAEMPGMDEKDIDIRFYKDTLTIKGEKKTEQEENNKGYYRMERAYGAFQRAIPIPVEVDPDKMEASFKKGILTVRLRKSDKAQKDVKKIPIKSE
ncbi:MAG: Hsp20/alpha crystallin family protein [Nitrospinales bacterium]